MGFWPYNETETVPCRYGWEYDLSNVPSSIVIDVSTQTFRDLVLDQYLIRYQLV